MTRICRLHSHLVLAIVALAAPIVVSAGDTQSLFFLELSGEIIRTDIKGQHAAVIAQGLNGPDGIAIDGQAGHVYWSNMGKVKQNDGSIMRADLDGGNVTTLVAPGGTYTPKQLKLDTKNRKIYWSDREGMRVMRANFDGSNVETLIVTGTTEDDRTDQRNWCVGIALDVERGHVYWTQKGGDNASHGFIKRMGLNIPAGQTAERRGDVELLFAGLPEPIDLDLDLKTRHIYWTDRGDNTVSRAPMDPPAGINPSKRSDRVILARGMKEAIGIALDFKHQRIFYTSLGGELSVVGFDGKKARSLITRPRGLTGIAILESSNR